MDDHESGGGLAKAKKVAGLVTGISLLSGKNSRIGNGVAILLLLAAGIADLITLIPFTGDIVGPMFWFCVAMFLWAKGCGLMNPGRTAAEVISTIAEMMPGIQELPTIIVGMAIIIILIRFEDRTGIPVTNLMSQVRTPLNKDGVRQPQIQGVSNSSRNQNMQPLNIDGVRSPSGNTGSSNIKKRMNNEEYEELKRNRRETDMELARHRQEELGLREKGKYVVNKEGEAEYEFGKQRTSEQMTTSGNGKYVKNRYGETVFRSNDELKEVADKKSAENAKELTERTEAAKSLGHTQEEAEKMGSETQQRENERRSKLDEIADTDI